MPLVSKNSRNVKEDVDVDDDGNESSSNRRSTSNFVPLSKATKDNNRKKTILLEYNNRTALSYREQNLVPPDSLDQQEKNFLSKVDPKVEPITRTVTKIVRSKAIDQHSKKKELKDYLVYYENWFGRDWLKRTVPPVTDHVEGRYEEVITEPVYQQQELIGYRYSGKKTVHYIPFSKEKVDEIIEKSIGSNKETIIYTFKSGPLRMELPYDIFVNLSFDELENILIAPNPKAELKKRLDEQKQKQIKKRAQQIIKEQQGQGQQTKQEQQQK